MNPMDCDERRRLKKYLAGVLYNNRKMIMKTRNMLENQQKDNEYENYDDINSDFMLESGFSIKEVDKDLQKKKIKKNKSI